MGLCENAMGSFMGDHKTIDTRLNESKLQYRTERQETRNTFSTYTHIPTRFVFDVLSAHINCLWLIHQYFRWNKSEHLIYSLDSFDNTIWIEYNTYTVLYMHILIILQAQLLLNVSHICVYITQMLTGSKVNSLIYELKTFVKWLVLLSFYLLCVWGNNSTNVISSNVYVHCVHIHWKTLGGSLRKRTMDGLRNGKASFPFIYNC